MMTRLIHGLVALPILLWTGSISLAQDSLLQQSETPASETVRVGIYQNEPKIFIDKIGEPAGFWIDVLAEIAQRERWTLVYVPCEWEVCLRSLQSGQLDLLPDVAYSPERDQGFDFNQKVILSSWSEVYVHPQVVVNSLLDLDQKRVGVLRQSSQQSSLIQQAQDFGIRLDLVEVSSFQEIFEQMRSGALDAGVVNVFYGKWNASDYNIQPTNLVFDPRQLYFAVPSDDPKSLVPRLDRQIQDLTADRNSIYYQSIDRWLFPPDTLGDQLRASWKLILLNGLAFISLMFALWIFVLIREVRQRQAVEAKLLHSEHRYASLVSALPVGIFRTDDQGNTIYCNDRCCEILGLSLEECLGTGWLSGLHPDDRDWVGAAWAKSLAENRPFRQEYRFVKPDGSVVWVDGQCLPEWDNHGSVTGYVGSLTDSSDRKQAEATVHAQEDRLRLAMQSAGMICWEHNFKTREMHLWGRYTPEGWQPESWQTTLEDFYLDIYPDDREQVQVAYALAVSNHTNLKLEYRFMLTGQTPIWLLSLGQVQKNAQGKPDRMVGICLDITDRKKMEAEVRDSEQRFRRAVENAPFPIIIHAEDGEVLQINGTWTSLTGYRHEDLPTTRHWVELAYGDRATEILEQTISQCYERETRWDEGDFTITTREGEKRIWHFHSAPLGLLPDRRRYVISMAIDMTYRRQTEAALRDREAFLRQLTNSVPGAMIQYILHPDGSDRVTYMSPGCLDLWEVHPEDLERDPKRLWQLVHPEDLPAMQASVLASAEQLTPWSWEWRIITAVTGQQKWVQGRGNPQRLGHGEIVWTTVIIDISDRKQAELDLLQAKEQAEQASRYKSSFLATMSHEIRTPMNGVLGMLNLLKTTGLDDNQRSYLEMAQISAESLLGLINDILDFSKIEAGKMELEEIDFDLVQELEDLAQTMAFSAYNKGLEFILEIRSFPRTRMMGDPRRLRQILTNLVGNAIKFTRQGSILLRLDLQSEPTEESLQWIISVTDTGIGIPADKLDLLFDSFTQVDASTTRQYGGSGLGLAIVKQLCQLMGGTIQVSSTINQGSCFTVTLPLRSSPLRLSAPANSQTLGSLTVLLLEDDPLLLQVLTEQLQRWGVTVISAWTLPQTLSTKIDLAIVDNHFLDAEGVAWFKALQHNPQFQDFGVIKMTTVNDRMNQAGIHQSAIDQSAIHQAGIDQSAIHQSAIHQAGIDQSAIHQAGIDQSAIHQSAIDHDPTNHHSTPALAIDGYLVKPVTPSQLLKVLSQRYQNDAPESRSQQNGHLEQPNRPWFSATRILVVEDSPINQAVIQGFLQILGIEADCAENGREALALLQQSTPDPYPLILMDCQMPELDGYETTRQIREGCAGDRYRQVPIIALTAHAMPTDRNQCLAAGMNDYLVKPLAVGDLDRSLRRWLGEVNRDQVNAEQVNRDHHEVFANAKPPSDSIPSTPADLPLFDPLGLLDRAEGHPDLAQMMCQRFLEGIPQSLQELKTILHPEASVHPEASETINFKDIERYAHRLKGSSSLIGAECFRHKAAYIEEIAKKNDPADLPYLRDMIRVLFTDFEQTKEAIEGWIGPITPEQ